MGDDGGYDPNHLALGTDLPLLKLLPVLQLLKVGDDGGVVLQHERLGLEVHQI